MRLWVIRRRRRRWQRARHFTTPLTISPNQGDGFACRGVGVRLKQLMMEVERGVWEQSSVDGGKPEEERKGRLPP
ncbi:hypothetical protein CesoFtcFv8_025376 [Champsocephalus esox]|uniref:Uncharacterized protein n=1 Tax=Champsocephalus esox TaxID=159716 RepID=A0AAN8GGY9_9TELE|nr:hypothetical protein CesoFtcFv8_025376 [Champsocephalus esox]